MSSESKQMMAGSVTDEPGAAAAGLIGEENSSLQRLALDDGDDDDEPVLYRSAGGVMAMPTQHSAAWEENESVMMNTKSMDALAMPSFSSSRPAVKASPSSPLASLTLLRDPLPDSIEEPQQQQPQHAQQPPAAPVYVEPSAFVVHSTDGAAHVLDAVAAALAARGEVRCTVQANNWCCVCVLLPGQSIHSHGSSSSLLPSDDEIVHFRVHLFHPNAALLTAQEKEQQEEQQANAVLVEFQRRSGSCVRFGTFVREMRSVLEQRLTPGSSPRAAAAAAPSAPGPCGLLPLEALWAELNSTEAEAGAAAAPASMIVAAPAAVSSSFEWTAALQQQQTSTVRTLLAMTSPDASLSSRTTAWASIASQLLPSDSSSDAPLPLCAATLSSCGPALAGAIRAVLAPAAAASTEAEPLCVRVQAARALLGLSRVASASSSPALRELLLEAVAVATKSAVPVVAAAAASEEAAMELAEQRLLERVYTSAITEATAALRS